MEIKLASPPALDQLLTTSNLGVSETSPEVTRAALPLLCIQPLPDPRRAEAALAVFPSRQTASPWKAGAVSLALQ